MLKIFTREPKSIELEPIAIAATQQPDEEYAALAQRLGVATHHSAAVFSLENVLRQEMMHIYPLDRVSRYMDSITPNGKVWCWKPLREADHKRCKASFNTTLGYNDTNGRFGDEIYARPVPYPVLVTVEKIETAFESQAIKPCFFVSDFTAKLPDPFLLVGMPGEFQNRAVDGRLWRANPEPLSFVVERWDEPKYR